MKLTTCVECGRVGDRSRCDEHSLGVTTTERGYGWDHQQAIAAPEFTAATHCDHCGDPFTVDNPRVGGHAVPRRSGEADDGVRLPHCRRCNSGWRRTGL